MDNINNNIKSMTSSARRMTPEERRASYKEQLDAVVTDVFRMSSGPRHYRTICRELGARGISLSDIKEGSKSRGLAEMLQLDICTLDDLVVLGQYAKAIEDADTRAAEWVRDTAGYKPTLDVTVEHKQDSLSQLSDEQLTKLLTALEASPVDEALGTEDNGNG